MNIDPTNNFVIFPREYKSAYRKGLVTAAEDIIYSYIRRDGDPYGVARVIISDLIEYYPGNVSVSWINKILLSLKSKKYIYYEPRPGRRGSFEVHMGDWILPNKQIKSLEKFFSQESVRPVPPLVSPKLSEPQTEYSSPSLSFEEMKKLMAQRFPTNPGKS
jgi:hypothetical protein